MAEPTESGITIKSISLVDSNFHKKPDYLASSSDKPRVEIQVLGSTGPDPSILRSEMVVEVSIGSETEKAVESKIRILGIFEPVNMDEEQKKSFIKVNGPAIMFPFVREHLAMLFLKAGLPPLYIQPVNFIEMARRMDEEERK